MTQNKGKTTKDQMGQIVAQADNGQPAVILVRSQLGENIGGAVRAMLNFGLSELRLVAPRDGWPNPAADAMAAGALPVLEQAKVFATTEEAVADLQYVAAATARRRDLEIPVVGTSNIGAKMRGHAREGLKCGIMFGPEKAGLTNDDVVLADEILTYPINPAFQSLNLAQAVGVFSYMWAASKDGHGGEDLPPVFNEPDTLPASREDLVRMFEHFEDELLKAGYFHPPAKMPLMKRNIRAPFIRAKNDRTRSSYNARHDQSISQRAGSG